MKAFFLWGLLLSPMAYGLDYYWLEDEIYGGVVLHSRAEMQANCEASAFSGYPTRLVTINETRIVCWDSRDRYRSAYSRIGDGCSSGYYDPETLSCVSSNPCLNAPPVSSHKYGQTACYNQCRYQTLGGFRDFDNALSPVAYEYIPTGDACFGNEAVDISSSAAEYTETNEDDLSCRVDGIYEVCIDADKSCKLINGVEVCIDNETREDFYNCGTFNGEVVCFQKNQQTNCGYVNGESLCVYPKGNIISLASPDHPANGGNGDQNETNDILDPLDISENTAEAQTIKQIVSETRLRQQVQKQAENDNPSSSFSGIECDKEVSCSGDPVQCAIARIEKKQLCMSEYNESEVQQIINDNPLMSPLGTLPGDTLEVHVEDFLETEGYISADNQCPEPLSFNVLGAEYHIVLTPICDLAVYISYFILFATWFSMSVLLAKALGAG